jgi:hypothetical protein
MAVEPTSSSNPSDAIQPPLNRRTVRELVPHLSVLTGDGMVDLDHADLTPGANGEHLLVFAWPGKGYWRAPFSEIDRTGFNCGTICQLSHPNEPKDLLLMGSSDAIAYLLAE